MNRFKIGDMVVLRAEEKSSPEVVIAGKVTKLLDRGEFNMKVMYLVAPKYLDDEVCNPGTRWREGGFRLMIFCPEYMKQ